MLGWFFSLLVSIQEKKGAEIFKELFSYDISKIMQIWDVRAVYLDNEHPELLVVIKLLRVTWEVDEFFRHFLLPTCLSLPSLQDQHFWEPWTNSHIFHCLLDQATVFKMHWGVTNLISKDQIMQFLAHVKTRWEPLPNQKVQLEIP